MSSEKMFGTYFPFLPSPIGSPHKQDESLFYQESEQPVTKAVAALELLFSQFQLARPLETKNQILDEMIRNFSHLKQKAFEHHGRSLPSVAARFQEREELSRGAMQREVDFVTNSMHALVRKELFSQCAMNAYATTHSRKEFCTKAYEWLLSSSASELYQLLPAWEYIKFLHAKGFVPECIECIKRFSGLFSSDIREQLLILEQSPTQEHCDNFFRKVNCTRITIQLAFYALHQNGLEYLSLNQELINNRGLIKVAFYSVYKNQREEVPTLYTMIPDNLHQEMHEFHAKLETLSLFPKKFPITTCLVKTFPDDFDICYLIMQIDSMALEYASDRIRNFSLIVQTAIMESAYSLRFASKLLQDNFEIVKRALLYDGLILAYASPRLQNEEDLVTIAVTQNGRALQFASERLKDNEKIVRIAVQSDYSSLALASLRLQKNQSFVSSCAVVLDFDPQER